MTDYLAKEGAPQPDKRGLYDAVPAAYFIGVCHGRATEPDRLIAMRERKLQLELEGLERAAAVERRELIPRKAIQPGIAAVMTRLTTDLVEVFEKELPPKYHGRGLLECVEINAAAVDRVLKNFKEGAQPLAPTPT